MFSYTRLSRCHPRAHTHTRTHAHSTRVQSHPHRNKKKVENSVDSLCDVYVAVVSPLSSHDVARTAEPTGTKVRALKVKVEKIRRRRWCQRRLPRSSTGAQILWRLFNLIRLNVWMQCTE